MKEGGREGQRGKEVRIGHEDGEGVEGEDHGTDTVWLWMKL